MLLSIVIPIYRVEKYIERCLDSIYNQNISEEMFSICLVNDGTPDDSVKLCLPYLNKHRNIKLVEQRNQGLSMARNIGLQNSKGEYVWFIDSDDELMPNSIQTVLNSIVAYKADCFLIGHEEVDDHGKSLNKYEYDDIVVVGKEFLETKMNDCEFFIPAQFTIWSSTFLRKNGFHFYPTIYHEDCEFTPKVLFKAKSVRCIKGVQYKYIRHANTISTSINPKRAYDYIIVADSLSSFNKNNGNATILYNFASLFINSALKIILKCPIKEMRAFNMYLKTHQSLLKHLSKNCTGKYRMSIRLIFILSKI